MTFTSSIKQIIYWSLVNVVAIYAFYSTYQMVDIEHRKDEGYDEKMWTSASISTYYMLLTDYQRPVEQVDPWFENYSKKYNILPAELDSSELQWYAADMWTFGWKAPNIGKLFMGASIVWGADTTVVKEGYFNKWYKPELRVGQGSNPPTQFIELARIPNAIFLLLTFAVVFLIGYQFFNPIVALLAMCYLVFNSTFVSVNTAVGLDSPSIFFSTLTLYFTFFLVRAINLKKTWKTLILLCLGIAISFPMAVGSKLNAALAGYTMATVFGVLALLMAKEWLTANESAKKLVTKQILTLLGGGVMIVGFTYVIFTASNPIFKEKASTKVKILQESVDDFFAIRARSKKTSKLKDNFKKSFELVFKRNFFKTEKLYYATLGSLIPIGFNPLDGLIYYLALIIMGFTALKWLFARSQINAEFILITWSLIFIWGNTDFIWTDFSRYHMPFYPSSALMIAMGIWLIYNYMQSLMKKPSGNSNPKV